MASIIDSFRETASDNLAFFKMGAFAIPLYFSYTNYVKNHSLDLLAYITLFFLFGFLIKTTSGVLNEKDTVLPPLNPFTLALAAAKGIIAVAPVAAISAFIANYFASIINIEPTVDIIMESILWLLVVAIGLTCFLMFVRREKIADAYNMKTISDKSADLMIAIIFFILQLVIVNIFTTVFIGYVLFVLFGLGPLLYFYIALAIVFNVGVSGHYLAQLQYEVLGYDRENL